MQGTICERCPLNLDVQTDRGPGWTIHLGKSETVLRTIRDGTVDALITDPPYGSGANSVAGRLKPSSSKYRSSDATPLPDIHGDSLIPEAWAEMIDQVLSQAYRVLKPGAPVLLFCDWRSLPGMMAKAGAVGFGIRSCVVWDKGRGSRPTPNGFRLQSELILFARKSGTATRLKHPVYMDGVLKFSTKSVGKKHLTEKPLDLMRELLKVVPEGGVVLDPFQGSATTGVAALERGCQYIGVESVPAYHQVARNRLIAASVTSGAI